MIDRQSNELITEVFDPGRNIFDVYGAPMAGRTVVFSSAGAELCSSVTDSTGTAGCGVVVKTNVAYRSLQKNGYTASFKGDSQYLPSSAHASVTG